MHKGWIALDIDGTITEEMDSIPQEIVIYLEGLEKQGWKILFVTGRTYAFARLVLHLFSMPYYLVLQHGADILLMPEKKLFSRAYLTHSAIDVLETVYVGQKEDFLVYSGYEKGDFCYYRPERFSQKVLNYIEKIKTLSIEPWVEVGAFPLGDFPLIKCIGEPKQMFAINSVLSVHPNLHITTIKDPISKEFYLSLVTDAKATKGNAIKRVLSAHKEKGRLIAAGDDLNDLSMLQIADVAIAIETGPQELLTIADIVAATPAKFGIITALQKATA